MIEVWLIISIIIIATCSFITWPVLTRSKSSVINEDRFEHDIRNYKTQLASVNRDLEQNLLTEDEAKFAKIEIQRKILLADSASKRAQDKVHIKDGNQVSTILSIFSICLFGSSLTYAILGSPGLPSYNLKEIKAQNASNTRNQQIENLRKRIDLLLRKLDDDPKNIQNWTNLGNIFISSRLYPEAQEAFENAYNLSPENTEISADYVESRILNKAGKVDQTSYQILKNLSVRDPHNPRILYYLGLAKNQKGRFKEALQIWTEIKDLSNGTETWLPALNNQIEKTNKLINLATETAGKNTKSLATKSSPKVKDMEMALDENEKQKMIYNMVNQLANRLKTDPDNLDGWIKLIRSYQVLGDKKKAKAANVEYKKALARSKEPVSTINE